jgi:hypothetical protein
VQPGALLVVLQTVGLLVWTGQVAVVVILVVSIPGGALFLTYVGKQVEVATVVQFPSFVQLPSKVHVEPRTAAYRVASRAACEAK